MSHLAHSYRPTAAAVARTPRAELGECEPRDAAPALSPRLTGLMHAVGLDVAYHRAAGDELFHRDEHGREVAVLDLVGGYGSLILGHHHPELVAELTRCLSAGVPVHAQGSLRPISEQLAASLEQRVSDACTDPGRGYHVVLASSGAEAIEAALKHAMLAGAGRVFIAIEGAFHGKTLGALQLAGNPAHREPFEGGGMSVQRVRLNDVAHLEAVFAAVQGPAGFIFEPMLGEGGVQPMSRAFAQRAAELCRQHNIPMIADECQTGLGRTGRFIACEHLGVQPDYLVLSKALGGGVVKLAALLVRRELYRPAFDLKHTSTFAGDEVSSAVGIKALALLDDALLDRVRQQGQRLLDALRRLAQRYPDVIADVRGRGLMLALELRPLARSESFMLRMLSASEDLALLAASYLLRVQRLRMAPTLSQPRTLRLQPSAFISDAQIDRVSEALDNLCRLLRRGDATALTAHLTSTLAPQTSPPVALRDDWRVCAYRPGVLNAASSAAPRRVGWLCHLIDDADLVSLEPAFVDQDGDARNRLLDRLAPLANPVVMSEVDVHSVTGQVVRLYPIMLPVTSSWMKRCMDGGATDATVALVQKGVDVADRLGCELVALGQYTSILTRGGRRLRADDIGLTTGNTYSLRLALDALMQAVQQRGIDPSRATVAVVGAAGNIGQTAARMLAPHHQCTVLLGSPRPGSRDRLTALARTLPRASIDTDPPALRRAQVVLVTTSAVDQPLGAEHFARDAVVCDLSVPGGLRGDVASARPDVMLIKGGIVRLPFEEDLGIVGFPLPLGQTYGCMAEALLLGFEGVVGRTFTGLVRPDGLAYVRNLAQRHGFVLADYKHQCVLGTQPREVTHVDVA